MKEHLAMDKVQMISPHLAENHTWAKSAFTNCRDVQIQHMEFQSGSISALMIYCEGLADVKQINETIIPTLRNYLSDFQLQSLKGDSIPSDWPLFPLTKETELNNLVPNVFNGKLVMFFETVPAAFLLDIANPPSRKPEEANTEISIRGPRDGFIEELSTNVALVRKRLRTNSMSYEQFTLGTRSHTKLGLLYLKDVVKPEIVEDIRNRLQAIETDAVYSSNELEELLAESKFTLFPLFDYTGRPDFVVASLLRGRCALLLDGVPTAIIAPANLMLLFKASEDVHNSYSNIIYGRVLRLFSLCITMLLPGFYIAIATYHQDQIPLTLLATLVNSRKGVPFPTPIEAMIMILLFELFREAGVRLPSSIGQTLSVVGGLIIGDAAIRAGLASPALLVVISATVVSSFTLVNQALIGGVSIIRAGILIFSSILGIYGFFLSLFVVLIMLANLRSFGVPYLAPISPVIWRDIVPALIRLPASFQQKRPKMLKVKDKTRGGGETK
jgi:hypothetical protein